MVRVKICGICDFDAAQAAVEAGADLLGFHFCSSDRHVSPEEAKAIVDALAVRPKIVGVFIDQDAAEVREIADFVGLDTRLRNLESLLHATGDQKWLPSKALREMVNQGYLGDPASRRGSKGGYYEFFEARP